MSHTRGQSAHVVSTRHHIEGSTIAIGDISRVSDFGSFRMDGPHTPNVALVLHEPLQPPCSVFFRFFYEFQISILLYFCLFGIPVYFYFFYLLLLCLG